ncbi:MAG: FAD-dependent oxidoreductase [Ghiorsea sp.]
MSQEPNMYDVVIVGGGAIGSALALRLSQLNYSVALLDKQLPSFQTNNPERVIALSEGSARFLDSLGVWDDILALGTGFIKDIVVCEPGAIGRAGMSHTEIDAQALGYVSEIRHVLKPIYAALKGKVDILCPAQCLSIENTDHVVSIQIQDEQGVRKIQTSLLVGADGTNSQVRKMVGVGTAGWDHNRSGIVASIKTKHGHGQKAFECFREDGPLALLPLADDRFSLVWSVAPRHGVELMKMKEDSFLKVLEQEVGEDVLGATGSFESVGKCASFPLELRIAKSFAKQGVVLVGNAAHTIHPIAGQGMNLGFRDVAVLADVLSQNWAKQDLISPLITQAYAERRRSDVVAVAGFTEGVLEAFSSKLFPVPWLRGKGLDGVDSTSVLKQMLLQQAAGLGQLKGLDL